jgi:hypothetical protein
MKGGGWERSGAWSVMELGAWSVERAAWGWGQSDFMVKLVELK